VARPKENDKWRTPQLWPSACSSRRPRLCLRKQAIDARDASLSSGQRGADTWDRFTAKNFTAVTPNGAIQTRAEQLAALKSMPAPAGAPPAVLKEQVDVYGMRPSVDFSVQLTSHGRSRCG